MVLFAAACSAPTGGFFDEEAADATAAKVVSCSGLGSSDAVFLKLSTSGVTATVEGNANYRGTAVTSGASSITFGKFTPKGFFESSTLVVPRALLEGKSAKVQMFTENVGPHWEGTCHAASQAELAADHCLSLLDGFAGIDTKKKPSIEKTPQGYRIRVASPKTGDFVWMAQTSTDGLLCKITDIPAVSCAAVVADAIGAQARADGSSAGEPYVNKTGTNTWSGGIHDPESGEFAYHVTTKGSADHCQVVSIKLMQDG